MNVDYDVIVVGGGAAGLMAANKLSEAGKRIIILEAKTRLGGRIYTIDQAPFSMPIELGAEFVHGKMPITRQLAKSAGTELYKVGGKIWREEGGALKEGEDFIEDYKLLEDAFKKLKEDISVADFFKQHLDKPEHEELRKTLKGYVEGYNAADLHKASALILKEDLENAGDDQYRIQGGYVTIVDYLAKQIKKSGASYFLETAVQEIVWEKEHVVVKTTKGAFTGNKILITVSPGVLQQSIIRFSPAIHTKMNIVKTIGFGNVIKFIYQFIKPFWQSNEFNNVRTTPDLAFLFSEQPVPTWWSQHPKQDAILTGWIGGPNTEKYTNFDEDALAELGLASIAAVYSLKKEALKQLVVAHKIINWKKDIETGGAYSFDSVGGEEKRKQFSQPIEDTIYFAGEALAEETETGTVEAALESGKTMAERILKV